MADPVRGAYDDTLLATTEPGRQLILAGLAPFLYTVELTPAAVRAWASPTLISVLLRDPRFASGVLHGLHPEVGTHRRDFRAYRGTFGKGSLQIVVDERTGKFYADVDHWNPYEDVVNWVGHAGEVLRGWWNRVRSH